MPTRRNGPVSSNVRPHRNRSCSSAPLNAIQVAPNQCSLSPLNQSPESSTANNWTSCCNSDPRARTATPLFRPTLLRRESVAMNAPSAPIAQRIFYPTYALTVVAASSQGRSGRRAIGRATTSLAPIQRQPQSSTGRSTCLRTSSWSISLASWRRSRDEHQVSAGGA